MSTIPFDVENLHLICHGNCRGRYYPKELPGYLTNATGKKNGIFVCIKISFSQQEIQFCLTASSVFSRVPVELRKVGSFTPAVIKKH